MKYAWIRRHERAYPLNAMCDVLGVSESGFAAWRAGSAAKRWLSTPQLLALIRAIHAEFNGAYGAPRMAREIKARGSPVSKERVGKLMQANRIRARHKCCYKATTNSAHHLPVAQNVLNRLFQTTAPDQVWTADITYIQTAEGWLYLAVIMDLYSRMIVGYAMDARMTKELVLNALRMARFKRKPKPGLMGQIGIGNNTPTKPPRARNAFLARLPAAEILQSFNCAARSGEINNAGEDRFSGAFMLTTTNPRASGNMHNTSSHAQQQLPTGRPTLRSSCAIHSRQGKTRMGIRSGAGASAGSHE